MCFVYSCLTWHLAKLTWRLLGSLHILQKLCSGCKIVIRDCQGVSPGWKLVSKILLGFSLNRRMNQSGPRMRTEELWILASMLFAVLCLYNIMPSWTPLVFHPSRMLSKHQIWMLHLLPKTKEQTDRLTIFPEGLQYFSGLPSTQSFKWWKAQRTYCFFLGAFNSLSTVSGIFIPRKPQNKGSKSTICWTACAKHKVFWPWKSLSCFQRVSHRGFAGVVSLPRYFPRPLVLHIAPRLFIPPHSGSSRLQICPCCLRTVFSRMLAKDQQMRVRTVFFHWMFQDSFQEAGPCSPIFGLRYWVPQLLSHG